MNHQPFPEFEPESTPSENVFQALVPIQQSNTQPGAEYYLDLGNRHYNSYLTKAKNQDLDRAIEHYRHALEMNPNLAEGYVKLASALWDQGSITLDTAIQYCRMALSINADNAEAYLFIGYFLQQAGQTDSAQESFRQAIQKAPLRSAKPRMALGRALLQQAVQKPAFAVLPKLALTLGGLGQVALGCLLLPTDSRTFAVLQNAFMMDMKIFGVMTLGRSLGTLGLKKQCIGLYEWAGKQLPQEPVFYHLLGDLHSDNQRPDTAIYYYNRAQELDPENLSLYKKLGAVYAQCNDKQNAARSLEKVAEVQQDDFDTLYSLAQLYTDQSDYIRALYYLKELCKRHPKNPYLHSNMAYALFKLEDYDGAVHEYKLAIKHGEDPLWTATVAQTLGTIHYQVRQDIDAAMEMFQLAYKLDSSNLECIAMLADLHIEQGNFEAAIGAYKYILTFEPDNADCYNYIGYLLWQMDRNEEAEEAYLKAIHFDPENYVSYNNLGVIYLDEQGNSLKALTFFEKALQLKPDYTLASFNIGRSQEAQGQISEAAKQYSDTLALNAENPELTDEEILERLDQLFEV